MLMYMYCQELFKRWERLGLGTRLGISNQKAWSIVLVSFPNPILGAIRMRTIAHGCGRPSMAPAAPYDMAIELESTGHMYMY